MTDRTDSNNSALAGIAPHVAAISLDNIANIAKQAFDKTDVLPLWFGEGDLQTPAFVGEAVAQAIRDGHVFYTYQNGIPELRQTLADYHTRLSSTAIGPERITVTSGGMPAIMLAVQLVLEPGDNIVVIDPVWPNIGGITRLLGGEVRSVRMDLDDAGWALDLEKVAAACDGRTKAIFYASPGNPTGAMIPLGVQQALLAFARQRGIWLIADEVYYRLVFGRTAGDTILDICEPEDRVLVINSFSKAWAMTGWRLGWLVHPPSLAPRLAMMVQYTTSGTTTFLQHAGIAAIREGEGFVAHMNRYCQEGMEIVCDALEQMPRVRLRARPTAAMYVFFEIDGMADSRAACLDILNATQVGLAPGVFFGKGSESFVRLCFCRSPDVLRAAMERLRPFLS
ncbi:pyridoxal phosphate-dependent aminotransferase [Pedomonas mirosovicensis]|uniref:pyridoxal phosphate-dependent aminotransferase n=1 Tax=Pedomonas mirosovicensis TaxID=2908641 RepID=UPI0021682B6C|nr:pyridoxal phosphate-dependent aminotransferase [Pedomonas mirosovicensis]MCH8686303.1 pyridoxal phosphate-dependent aminotransferase [Pedomonas mirosovicensis]